VVREGQAPEDVPRVELEATETTHLPAVLVEHLGVPSTSEARRLIDQGAVKLNGEVVRELNVPTSMLDGALLQAGKRRFAATFVL
jgi:tyrosyl-tRNA synthetase